MKMCLRKINLTTFSRKTGAETPIGRGIYRERLGEGHLGPEGRRAWDG